MDPVRIYDYLTQARARLFDWVRPLGQEQYTREFPFGMKSLRATLVEMARGEWAYGHRLRGEPLPPPDQWPVREDRLPAFADLERFWTEMAPRTRALLAGITDWATEVTYQFARPGQPVVWITATKADLVTQMLLHEVHHRAQAMAMLRQLGVAAQNLDYSAFMFRRREASA
ncbi:MAG: DinB family protein [Armatimonadota bacterium]|nr:DinB family protein [Armatimonadota bacterium]